MPLNPERDGAHELTDNKTHPQHKGPWVCLWSAVDGRWCETWGNIEPPEAMAEHVYVGPCLTTAALAAALAQARRDALEEAVVIAERAIPTANPPRIDGYGHHVAGERYAAEQIAAAIRAKAQEAPDE